MFERIRPLEELRGFRGVLCHGCFDGIHPGHVALLRWASSLCQGDEVLVATVTADAFNNKGMNRPAYPEDVRARCLESIRWVDYVAIVYGTSAIPAIKNIQPRLYVRGGTDDPTPEERLLLDAAGTEVVYMPKEWLKGAPYSSTRILSGEYLKQRPRGIGEGEIGVE